VSAAAFGAAAALLRDVQATLEGPAWVVGGAVRDALLGRAVHDLDLVLPEGSLAAARRLADRLGASFVPIGAPHGVGRVVVREPSPLRIDVADLRAPTLEADLAGRDVTINALAVALDALVAGEAAVVDPLGGLLDLRSRRLRACGPASFRDDPVRVLRLLRLAHALGFTPEAATEAAARRAVAALPGVAAERIREELTEVLRLPQVAPPLRDADAWGAVDALLPEAAAMRAATQSAPHRFTVWEHSLRALEAADRLVADLSLFGPHAGRIAASFAEPLGSGLSRREVWRLAVLLHDVAKPETRSVEADGRVRFIGHDRIGAERAAAIAARLAWPGRAAAVLRHLVRQHLRPMHLGTLETISARALYRFFRDVGEEVPALVCLTIADAAATDGRQPVEVYRGATRALLDRLLAGELEAAREAEAPPLVRGDDVMAAFGLPPGPAVGRLLRRAREAQALGLVRSREEALAWLAREPEDPDDEGIDGVPARGKRTGGVGSGGPSAPIDSPPAA
jgi:putative nucleotidyltransferase with HDIG domain